MGLCVLQVYAFTLDQPHFSQITNSVCNQWVSALIYYSLKSRTTLL